MKKFLSFLLCLIYFFSFSLSFAEKEYDFRFVKWDMTIQEVKAIEVDLISDLGNSLLYKAFIAGQEANITYFFTDKKLEMINCVVNLQGLNKVEKIDKYLDIRNDFENSYGKYISDYRENEQLKDVFSSHPRTMATLSMSYDNDSILIMLLKSGD